MILSSQEKGLVRVQTWLLRVSKQTSGHGTQLSTDSYMHMTIQKGIQMVIYLQKKNFLLKHADVPNR